MSEFRPQTDVPDTWYKYPWPLTANRPQPSGADYSEENVAQLIKSFALILGREPSEIALRYEANTPAPQTSDDIIVGWAGSAPPCRDAVPFREDLPGRNVAMDRYTRAAKRSRILKKFQDNSPAGIVYFQPFDSCNAF